MALLPFEVGAVNVTEACVFPAVASPIVGVPGTAAAVPLNIASRVVAPGALEVTCNVAFLAPVDVGAKVTLMLQLAPDAKEGVRLLQGKMPPGATLN